VRRGPRAIRRRFEELKAAGVRIAVIDAIVNDDLLALGAAVADMPLVTAASGVAIGLPQNFVRAGLLTQGAVAAQLPRATGARAIVSGSCSPATNGQVRDFVAAGGAAFALDPQRLADAEDQVERALAWAKPRLARGPVLVYSTAEPRSVKAAQERLGPDAGALIERALAAVARGLVTAGVKQLIVAGGETSGAVVQALGIQVLRIGPQIDPGVPWTAAMGECQILLALKSGNFGAPDFFSKAFAQLAY
jgi:uncharacterized protein YgbK (DUF1537 family)